MMRGASWAPAEYRWNLAAERGSGRRQGGAVEAEHRAPQLVGLRLRVDDDAVVHALIIFLALDRVGEDFVSLGDAFEARLGAGRGVAVRVEAHRQRAVDLLDFVIRGVGRDTEHIVYIFH